MFFDDLAELPIIAKRVSTAIFVVPDDTKIPLPNITEITRPADKKNISIEQIRSVLELGTKQITDQYIIIRQAELLSPGASNALLKVLEEPREHYHFLLLTENPSALLPTILSRAELFCLRVKNPLQQKPAASPEIMQLAKQLLASQPSDLPALADQLAKHKANPREHALQVVATAIELAYKSYFATNNRKFLKQLPNLTQLHHNLTAGGNLKLHIVADLC